MKNADSKDSKQASKISSQVSLNSQDEITSRLITPEKVSDKIRSEYWLKSELSSDKKDDRQSLYANTA